MDRVIIPANSRDGLIYGFSIPDSDWNYSLPHGAGRLLKRSEVSNHYTVSSFKKAMKDVYSSTISKDTLDECPMAYRDIEYLKDNLKDVLSIVDIWKPVYNFKNGSKE
jgi:RNA-splicing ligase RtcB